MKRSYLPGKIISLTCFAITGVVLYAAAVTPPDPDATYGEIEQEEIEFIPTAFAATANEKRVKQRVSNELTKLTKFHCAGALAGCEKLVRSCVEEIQKDLKACHKKYPAGYKYQAMGDDKCAATIIDYSPMTLEDKAQYCAGYFVKRAPK